MQIHRWIGLCLSPIFLIIILSGAVLSFKPVLQKGRPEIATTAAVDVAALKTLVGNFEAKGTLNTLAVVNAGKAIDVSSSTPGLTGRWDLATGARTDAPAAPIDVFGLAEQIHKSLLIGLGFVVEAASFAMLGLMLLGPFLAALRFRNSLTGWHHAIGLCLLPITLVSPLTAVLMTLNIGKGGVPLPRAAHPVSISEALALAAPTVDLSHLVAAHPFRGGTVMLQTAGNGVYAVSDQTAVKLTGGPGLIQQIHEGTWAGAWSGLLNLAISLLLLTLTVTGFTSWWRRWRRDRKGELVAGSTLVIHASQTGTATRLAEATVRLLQAAGETVSLAPLATFKPRDLSLYPSVLIIASSTGEGDLPDSAHVFVRALTPGSATGVRFALLGLGDRRYATFCGGAEKLRSALLAAGGTEEVPMVRADGDPAESWADWLSAVRPHLQRANGAPEVIAARPTVELTLVERHRLDDPGAGDTQETWGITLQSEVDLTFRPGDLLRLSPGAGEAERSYSIGSSARLDPRRIELTVSLHAANDISGRQILGQMSGQLTRTLPLGTVLAARLDTHGSFHPPVDPQWPIIMIAAGSGIAPFPGFIRERSASGKAGPAWLLFGNRHLRGDFLWADRFTAALKDGSLTRLDTAFSRDSDDGTHIQTRITNAADEIVTWLRDRKAMVYICGRRRLATGVLTTLADILARSQGVSQARAEAELETWLAEGRIRIDAFD